MKNPHSLPLLWGCMRLGILAASVASGSESVSVAWDPSPEAAGYCVRWTTDGGRCWSSTDTGTNLHITILGLTEGATCSIQVTAYNSEKIESPPTTITYLVPGALQVFFLQAGSHAHLRFSVAAFHSYQVEATQDFRSWTTVDQVTAKSNCWMQSLDPDTMAFPKRFYRLVSLP